MRFHQPVGVAHQPNFNNINHNFNHLNSSNINNNNINVDSEYLRNSDSDTLFNNNSTANNDTRNFNHLNVTESVEKCGDNGNSDKNRNLSVENNNVASFPKNNTQNFPINNTNNNNFNCNRSHSENNNQSENIVKCKSDSKYFNSYLSNQNSNNNNNIVENGNVISSDYVEFELTTENLTKVSGNGCICDILL